jgi:hypothetical protein
MKGRGAAGHHDPLQALFLYALPDEALARLGAHVLVILAMLDAGIFTDLLDDFGDIYGSSDVVAAMADKNPYFSHLSLYFQDLLF